MKKYKAKMRFRAVTNAIIMTNRMKGRFRSSTKSPESTTPSEKTEEKINMLLDDSKSDQDAETGELSLKDDLSPVSTSVSMPHSPAAEAEHSDTYVDTEEEIQVFNNQSLPLSLHFPLLLSLPKSLLISTLLSFHFSFSYSSSHIFCSFYLLFNLFFLASFILFYPFQARIAAAAERKKSKMLIITHAALDDSSLEEDDSHMRACID